MKWKVQPDRDVYEWFAWYPVTVKIDGEEYWVWWERVKVLEHYNWAGVSYTYYVMAKR